MTLTAIIIGVVFFAVVITVQYRVIRDMQRGAQTDANIIGEQWDMIDKLTADLAHATRNDHRDSRGRFTKAPDAV